MPADSLFFDTSYLARFYLEDRGFEAVRELAGTAETVASTWHAQAETVAALHRAFRERRMEKGAYLAALAQFGQDRTDGLFRWLPLTDGVQRRLEQVFQETPATVFLRGADALHLACAAEHGYRQVYSHDRQFLAAAPLFGLRGVDVLDTQTPE